MKMSLKIKNKLTDMKAYTQERNHTFVGPLIHCPSSSNWHIKNKAYKTKSKQKVYKKVFHRRMGHIVFKKINKK